MIRSFRLLPHVMLTGLLFAAVPAVVRGADAGEAGMPRIHFSQDLPATLATALKSGKPVVVVFAAAWCPNCRRMEEETFAPPEIRALADEFLWVHIDIDRNFTLVRSYDVRAVPQVYFLDSRGNRRGRTLGTVKPASSRTS